MNDNTPPTALPSVPPEQVAKLEFFQAVHWLEALAARGNPSHASVGGRGPSEQESVRFKVSTSMAFPTSDLESITWSPPEGRAQEGGQLEGTQLQGTQLEHMQTSPSAMGRARAIVTTHFLGLVGSNSPLPLTYVDEVLQSEHDVPQLKAFLDVFHHRLLSLLYGSWRIHHPDQCEGEAATALLQNLATLVGVPVSTASPGSAPPLRYMGLFALSTRPAEGLALLLRQELGLPLEVIPLRLRRVEIPAQERCRFGSGGGRHHLGRHRMGRNIVLGRRIWDRSGAATVVIGPLTRAQLADFGPEGAAISHIQALIAGYLAAPLDVQLELRIPPEEMPRVRLGGREKTRLGRLAVMGRARREVRVRVESAWG